MTDDRRMSTDRFYGGVEGRLEILQQMLTFLAESGDTDSGDGVSEDRLTDWIISNTQAESPDAIQHHLNFLEAIDLITSKDGEYEITPRSRYYLEEQDSEILYDALRSGVKGFDTILQALSVEPRTDEELMELLVDEFEECNMETPAVAQRHREWLQAIGYVDHQDGRNSLTSDGRQRAEQIEELSAGGTTELTDYSEATEGQQSTDLDFELNAVYERRKLHDKYGGIRQSGIAPSRGTPVVFLFSGTSGESHGYRDYFRSDGSVIYTGEGNVGDMEMVRGNKAIKDHQEDGRELHLFRIEDEGVRYLGQFRYADHHWRELPDSNDEPRDAVLFELEPVGDVITDRFATEGESPLERGESGHIWSTPDDLDSPEHPLVERALDSDTSIYKFTAPPDYWLTAFEYAALSFEPPKEDQWNDLDPGDIVVFHSRQDPSWEELSSQESCLLGAGIVRKKTTKAEDEAWSYDEHEGGPKGDSFPYVVAFDRLFATGRFDEIDFTRRIIEKSPELVDAELAALTEDALPFDEANTICQKVSDTGFPRHQTLERLSSDSDIDKGTALLDVLAERVQEIPAIAVHKGFTGNISPDILADLHFPEDLGNEIVAQIEVALRSGKHTILTGPPGTGKTEIARRVCKYLADEYPYLFSGSQMTTATADWSTFDTIGGYMPDADTDKSDTLEFSPGLILNRFKDRRDTYQLNDLLIIDELNRADIDKAFGQLFTVLSGQPVRLPYTRDGAEIELTPADSSPGNPAAHEYVIPESWRLFATLNTYDKTSLYEMSYAFMRRFAFIRVPAPELPGGEEELEDLMHAYADAWGIDPDRVELFNVGRVWRATNDAVEGRAVGPAVVKDILEYVTNHRTADETTRLTQAVISFIFPQLEGVPKRERIIREIANVRQIDEEELDQAARDMLQVSLTTDE